MDTNPKLHRQYHQRHIETNHNSNKEEYGREEQTVSCPTHDGKPKQIAKHDDDDDGNRIVEIKEIITHEMSQPTTVLINGHQVEDNTGSNENEGNRDGETVQLSDADGTEQPAIGPPEGPSSSRNSSGDAMSLRETLQQLPATITPHRHRRTLSPHTASRRVHETSADASFHRGILGFMEREIKQVSPTPSAPSNCSGSGKHHSLSEPTGSPPQYSVRSRNSLEKSPRRKRSKSESKRRRERKLIAAGEMEVRQANETLMHYLKQCSEMNDASLSGELEIDQNLEDRRVHRKTKSQRDKRGHIINKLYAGGGLSSILKELSEDIVPTGDEEIYNPFTPVVSPTEDIPAHIDKMFMQTSSGYQPINSLYYKHPYKHSGCGLSRGSDTATATRRTSNDVQSNNGYGTNTHMHIHYTDTCCLLDGEHHSREVNTNIELSCYIQRIWLLLSNICHGLLAGIALAHLLLILSSNPVNWLNMMRIEDELISDQQQTTNNTTNANIHRNLAELPNDNSTILKSYQATFLNIYINTFYCLAIICMVSVLDRIDICRWSLASAGELISFRWLIITMLYLVTIILSICSDPLNETSDLFQQPSSNTVSNIQKQWMNNVIISSWGSLSVTRSICSICGWIMIALARYEDRLYEHLCNLSKYQIINNNH